jgi:polysaccharide pyruvyl transferase CsaB
LNRSLDVLVCGYYGFGNLGDELLAEAVVSLLEKAGIDKQRIGILSAAPQETAGKLGVRSFNRWSVSEVYNTMRDARTLLLGGGGLFQDTTSVKSCLYYWGIVRMAGICGARPWAAGQSIGPFRTQVASFLAKNAFASCVYRGVRNRSSLGTLNNWGLIGDISPDLVMSLNIDRSFPRGDRLLLNLRGEYGRMSRLAVKYAAKVSEEKGLNVIGVAFSEEDLAELRKYSSWSDLKLEKIVLIKKLAEFEDIITGSSYAMGMRMHFLVLAQLAGLSLCGIPYDPKVRAFCEEWNIPSACGGSIDFSVPSDVRELNEAAEKVADSFKQGLESALGGSDGKKQG